MDGDKIHKRRARSSVLGDFGVAAHARLRVRMGGGSG
jgi:hypothetical protein